jgi:hypothetical protein
MRFYKDFLISLSIFTLTFFGCATTQPAATNEYIEQQLSRVDTTDGIDKREAIILAQNYLLKNPPDQSSNPAKRNVDINRFDTREFDDKYKIEFDFIFEDGKPFMYPFYWSVIVDKKNGQILSSSFDGHK